MPLWTVECWATRERADLPGYAQYWRVRSALGTLFGEYSEDDAEIVHDESHTLYATEAVLAAYAKDAADKLRQWRNSGLPRSWLVE